jgi:exodeoxyribonuclease VII small subunit
MSEPTESNLSFEASLAELERIVHDLEDGGLGLEESLSRYEQGVGLLKRCYAQLRNAEQRIRMLVDVNDDDEPELESFEHSATAEPAKPSARRRSSKRAGGEGLPF